MTENEALNFMRIEKECINRNCDRNCINCDIVQEVDNLNSAYDMAIKTLKEVQQYHELTDRLKAIYGDQMTLKIMVDVMENVIRDPGYKHPVIARILTCNEAVMWDEYRKIGTPEECREDMEKQKRKLVKNPYGTSYIWKAGYCPVCGCGVTARWDYCQCCGQKLSWENA